MTRFLEKTDYIERLFVPNNPIFTISHEDVNQTYGEELLSHYIPLSAEGNLIDHALETLRQIKNPEMSNRSMGILLLIQKHINSFRQNNIDIPYLPKIYGFFVDDGSILLEWIFSDFRIGFSIEPVSEESSWFLVTNQKHGEISASGYLSDQNEKIILWLIYFVLGNS